MTQAPTTVLPRARVATHSGRLEAALSLAAMWAMPLLMLATIAGVLVVGVPVTYASALLLAGAVIVSALRAQWLHATAFYFTYAAMEGLYKYTTNFSNTIYVIKPFLVLFLGFVWWLSLKIDGRRPVWPSLTGLLTVMACVGVVQAFHPFGSGPFLSLATLFLWYLAPTFFYFLLCNELKTPLQTRQILLYLLAIATVVSFFAAFQYGMGQKWLEAHLPGYARMTLGTSQWWLRDSIGKVITSFRPASTTAYTTLAASWSYVGIMLACSFFIESRSGWKRTFITVILMINAIGLMVTGVRVFVVICILSVTMLLVLTSRSKRQLFRNLLIMSLFSSVAWGGFMVAEIFSGGILQKRYAATLADPLGKFGEDRGKNMSFLPMFVPQYPLGIGFQRGSGDRDGVDAVKASTFVAKDPMVFNRETQFNAMTADLGIPGLIFFIALVSSVFSIAYKTQRDLKTPHAQQIAAVVLVILVGFIVSGLSFPSIQGSELFYLLVALATRLPVLPQVSWQDALPGEASTARKNAFKSAPRVKGALPR